MNQYKSYLTHSLVKMKETKLSKLAVTMFLTVLECLEYKPNNSNFHYDN